MRKIRLTLALEFGRRAEFAIIDVTEGADKTRGNITIDYAPADVNQLKEQGLDMNGAMEYYKDRIYGLVKYYISGDWEDAGGYDDALDIISKHIQQYV